MKIKQQSAIKQFLVQEFGEQKGLLYFGKQELFLQNIINTTKGKSKRQFKTLTKTILPRIALYRILMRFEPDKNIAFDTMRKYMIDMVAASKHRSTANMEKIPGFFYIYKTAFLKIMRTTDLQDSIQEHGRKYYNITITRCLWHDACVEHGCPELCPLFCDVDDVTYGGLHKIGFSRTKTIGYGGDCCDFHFFQKYDEVSDDAFCIPVRDDVTEKAVNYGRKIAAYRSWQIGVFAVAVVALLTMVFPWFGYRGITEISGTTILRSPFALIGIVLFVFAVWYNFKSKHSRKICGYIGWGLWLFSDLYNFITIPMGSTVGVQWGPLNFEIPYFANFSLTNCFQNTLPGFYAGVLALFAVGVAFYFFVKKAAMDTV